MKNILIRLTILNIFIASFFLFISSPSASQNIVTKEGHVAIIDMEMLILPGTQGHLEKSIRKAENSNAKLLIVKLNTPGGVLQTTQKMITAIFQSKVPVVIYVSPTGGTATSAGVFITMAGHIAAMAPGTSIGAAHPVTGDGKDIEGDMRKKVEEMTSALVKSIASQRGRNVEWAEKAVRESVSLTAAEALKQNVVDIVAKDIDDLLVQVAGKKVVLGQSDAEYLPDYTKLPRHDYKIDYRDAALNVLANPNIAALLWLGATTGLSVELYNPGLIFPGVFGLICLVLALFVSQIIPVTQGGILLMLLGGLLIVAELYIPSGILGFGGLIAFVIGSFYLIDITQAPGLMVSKELIIAMVLFTGALLLWVIRAIASSEAQKPLTGLESLVGRSVVVREPVSTSGKVFIDGEIWNARADKGLIDKGQSAKVVEVLPGSILKVALRNEGS